MSALPAEIVAAIDALEQWHDDALRGYGGGNCGEIRAALDAAILKHLCEWQPISTAPKDGAQILAWSENDGTFVGHCWSGQWWDDNDSPCGPTLWMPLPEPAAPGAAR